MQTTIVSGALFFVMVLLLLVVYDSNPTVRRILSRAHRRLTSRSKRAAEEANMDHIPDNMATSAEAGFAMSDLEAPGMPPDPQGNSAEKPSGVLQWYVRYLSKPVRMIVSARERRQRNSAQDEGSAAPGKKRRFGLGRGAGDKGSIETLNSAVEELARRLMQIEATIDRMPQIEEELGRVNETTEFVSEEMKDILGSLRASIDGLEARIDQADSELRDVKETQAIALGAGEETGLDEETRARIDRLESLASELAETIKTLPPEVRSALSNSQNANRTAEDLKARLDTMVGNLQATMGYGLRNTFTCESCGSAGLVASQVFCSKCGTGTWWGWFPSETEPTPARDHTAREPNTPEYTDSDVYRETDQVIESAEMLHSVQEELDEAEGIPPESDDFLIGAETQTGDAGLSRTAPDPGAADNSPPEQPLAGGFDDDDFIIGE